MAIRVQYVYIILTRVSLFKFTRFFNYFKLLNLNTPTQNLPTSFALHQAGSIMMAVRNRRWVLYILWITKGCRPSGW